MSFSRFITAIFLTLVSPSVDVPPSSSSRAARKKKCPACSFALILADEAMDASNQEQLALVLRYVHQDAIYEDFIGFLHLKDGLTGEHLANAILSFF